MSVSSKKASNPLLTAYLSQLSLHPLRTKAITAGTLSFIQELLASHLSNSPPPHAPKNAHKLFHILASLRIDSKALKMAIYGFFISAPLGHVLVGLLQRAFAGKNGARAKLGQILASNLLVAPVQASVYLASMAVINGARTVEDVIRTVQSGFMAIMRINWITSPLALVVAQRFIPQELWVPFFNLVGFSIGTYFGVRVKQARLEAEKKAKRAKEEKENAEKQSSARIDLTDWLRPTIVHNLIPPTDISPLIFLSV
ncbi:integral membrane Mpv17 PMP23 family [Pyrrhoderma noxium]|uniref:Integral membrane Mpv17 PMP23 family n=1 Tax=Pyrrhoderma noxium TaxID=2282107 RepID=A0A286URR1_9AGAM|nr:integral membrane Mpv17 PMP23 family [Pyrrhoderma noxium]